MGRRVIVIGAGLGDLGRHLAAGRRLSGRGLSRRTSTSAESSTSASCRASASTWGPRSSSCRTSSSGAGRRPEDYLQLDELKPQWRSFFEDGTVIDLHPDMQVMERELERLGHHARGYWAFLEHSRMLYKFAEEAYFERGADTLSAISRGHGWLELARKTDITRTTSETCGRSPRSSPCPPIRRSTSRTPALPIRRSRPPASRRSTCWSRCRTCEAASTGARQPRSCGRRCSTRISARLIMQRDMF